MIRLEGILKDALGNAVLPQALIEFISKVNAGKALIQSTVYEKTNGQGAYDFTMKSGEYDVFDQVSRSSDVDFTGNCLITPNLEGEYTLEGLMIFDEPIPPPSVATLIEIRDPLLEAPTQLDDDQAALNLTPLNQSYVTAHSQFSSVQTMHQDMQITFGAIVDYHATIDGVIVEGIASSDAGASVSGLPLLVHVVNGC